MSTGVSPIITKDELLRIVPYSIQHIGRLEKRLQFPKRICLGRRRVGWRLCEVESWLEERANTSESVLRPMRRGKGMHQDEQQ